MKRTPKKKWIKIVMDRADCDEATAERILNDCVEWHWDIDGAIKMHRSGLEMSCVYPSDAEAWFDETRRLQEKYFNIKY